MFRWVSFSFPPRGRVFNSRAFLLFMCLQKGGEGWDPPGRPALPFGIANLGGNRCRSLDRYRSPSSPVPTQHERTNEQNESQVRPLASSISTLETGAT